jgi:hypothetical protein
LITEAKIEKAEIFRVLIKDLEIKSKQKIIIQREMLCSREIKVHSNVNRRKIFLQDLIIMAMIKISK